MVEPRRGSAAAAWLALAILACAGETRAGFVSASGTATITISQSGSPPVSSVSFSGAIPAAFPTVLSFGAGIPAPGGGFSTEGFGAIAYAFDESSNSFGVFIPTSPPASSPSFISQAALPGGITSKTEIDFSVTFVADAVGLPAQLRTVSYPMFSVLTPIESGTFSGNISYATGVTPLGMQTISYTALPGAGVLGTATGTTLLLPALAPFSTLTVSGSFILTESSGTTGGPPGELKILGVPEPSSLALLGTAAAVIAPRAIRRRRRP
jgi:hypothetical protein